MGKFEKEYVLPVEERIALKEQRITYQRSIKKQLDSIDLSDKKRARILRQLKRNPFSDKTQKSIYANLELENEEPKIIEE